MSDPLLIGTQNKGKAAELAALLKGLPWHVRTLADYPPVPDPIEDGDTFEANAIKKARCFSQAHGVACVADDSGLAVDALAGAPGVYSARYSGPGATDVSNNAKLLDALRDVADAERTARFVCCVAFLRPGDSQCHIETGAVEGRIAFEPRGSNGFGYDPLFIPNGCFITFGEIDPEQKLLLSHRGNALRKLRIYLESLG